MTQQELIYITTIAREQSISKAAALLYVAQPSLSRGLRKIENEIGLPLFKRLPGGLQLTQAGEYYIKYADSILKSYKEMEICFSNLNNLKSGKVVIGVPSFLGSFVLPDIISIFHLLYPNIEISIIEGVSQDIEEAVLHGTVDFGILHTPISDPKLRQEVICKERFLLAVPSDDPLNQMCYTKPDGSERYLDITLTEKHNYIMMHPDQRARENTDGILGRAGLHPQIKFLTKSLRTAARMANANLGVTLIPHTLCLEFGRDYSLSFYFLNPSLKPFWEVVICYSDEIPRSLAAEKALCICRDTIPQIYREFSKF